MDNLGYIINRHFILVAVDTNFVDEIRETKLSLPNAKKVFNLNSTNLISVIGNQLKSSDIRKYVLKLNSLGHAKNFDSIIEDLKDIFNADNTNIIEGLKEVSGIISEKEEVNINHLFAQLQSKPGLTNLLKDVLTQLQNGTPLITQAMIFSWDNAAHSSRLSHLVYMGNNLSGNEDAQMIEDFIYIKFATAKLKNPISPAEEREMLNSIKLENGWDVDPEKISEVIDKAKQILSDGLHKMNSYETKPNIVFYELSHRTNFKFTIPEMHLVEITYTRN